MAFTERLTIPLRSQIKNCEFPPELSGWQDCATWWNERCQKIL